MTIRRDTDESREVFARLRLDPAVRDDKIVALAVRHRDEGLNVRVATADGGLEMKLEDAGIHVIVLPDRWRLPAEPDPERLRAEKAERELRAHRDRLPGLAISWGRSGVLVRQPAIGGVEEYVKAALRQAEEAYRAMQSTRRRWPEVSIYDPHHHSDMALMVTFLRQQHAWLSRARGAVRFGLSVANNGTLAALNVRVRLHAPAGVLFYGPGGFGAKPVMGPYVTEAFAGIPVHSAGAEIDLDAAPIYSSDGHLAVLADRRVAEFTWARMQQLSGARGVEFWLVATGAAAPGSSSVRAEVICDEIGGAASASLALAVVE